MIPLSAHFSLLIRTLLIFAGQSKRFWPLREKSFFSVAGTTLLQEQVKRLTVAGVQDIMLVGGAHNLTEASIRFPQLRTIEQGDLTLGMRGALLSALPMCGDGPVMIVSANDVIDSAAYASLLNQSKAKKTGGLILARKVGTYFPGGYLSVAGKRITSIVEKPGAGNEPSDLVNLVAHVHGSASEVLTALRAIVPTKDDGYEVALDVLFRKQNYEYVAYEGSWHAVKYPWHLLDLLPSLLPSSGKPVIDRSATIHPSAVVEGPVVIGKSVKVMAHASVIGPCTIGDETIIANNALVRSSSIGPRCVVGYSTEICRSILGENVWTHMNYIGDSIIGNDVSLGGGATTGNLRLDEGAIFSVVQGERTPTNRIKLGAIIGDRCRLGASVTLMPGVKIGAGTHIASGLVIDTDVPDASFVKTKGGYEVEIRPNRMIDPMGKDRERFRRTL